MRYIGKSKIGKQYSKPTIIYPIIRLPLQCSEAIGTSVQIYKTEHAGQSAFVIIPDHEDSERLRQEVAQLISKVAQPETENSIESRLSSLESQIAELKSLIFQGGSENNAESQNQRPRAGFEPASWPPQGGLF